MQGDAVLFYRLGWTHGVPPLVSGLGLGPGSEQGLRSRKCAPDCGPVKRRLPCIVLSIGIGPVLSKSSQCLGIIVDYLKKVCQSSHLVVQGGPLQWIVPLPIDLEDRVVGWPCLVVRDVA